MKRLALAVVVVTMVVACSDPSGPVAPRAAARPDAARVATDAPIPGRYIVVFKDRVTNVDAVANRIAAKHGGKLLHIYKAALKGIALTLADAQVAALRADPDVSYVEQDQMFHAGGTQTGATWGLDRVDQRSRPLDTKYFYSYDGTGVTVYILDTGINFAHVDFGGRATTGVDEITPGGTADDCVGHGTHVAGTVGGATYGVAKNVQLVAVRVLDCSGNGPTTGVIAGLDWVVANRTLPAVANMSLWGGVSAALNQAVARATSAGVTTAVIAGNAGDNACNYSPASEASAITVGATDINDNFASFSNYGSCVTLNAPGVAITSDSIGSTTATGTESGTSMASPHVAGAAALYLQANPAATPAEVKSALLGLATGGVIASIGPETPNLLLHTNALDGTFTGPSYTSYPQRCDWGIAVSGGRPPFTYSIAIQDPSFQPPTGTTATLTAGVYTTQTKTVWVYYSVTDAAGVQRQVSRTFQNLGYTSSDYYCHY